MTTLTKTEAIKEAINKLFGDTSVSPEETLINLKEIADEVELLIDAIEQDMRDRATN